MRVRPACRRLRVRSWGPATFFCGDWSGNHFYGHSLPTPDSSRAVVSYWRKDVHLVLVNRLGSLSRNSVIRLTDHLHMTIAVGWDVKPQIKQSKKSEKFGQPENDCHFPLNNVVSPYSNTDRMINFVDSFRSSMMWVYTVCPGWRSSLIWVFTVCPAGLFVWQLRIVTVCWMQSWSIKYHFEEVVVCIKYHFEEVVVCVCVFAKSWECIECLFMPGKAVLWRALIKWCMFSCTDAFYNLHNYEEPHHDKTNKMTCTQQRLRSAWHPSILIRVFTVCMKKPWVLSYPLSAQRRLWSVWVDAQADLSLRQVHGSFCWFYHLAEPQQILQNEVYPVKTWISLFICAVWSVTTGHLYG